jgi:hypothetical protein
MTPFPAFKRAKLSAVSYNYTRALNIARIKQMECWGAYLGMYNKQVVAEKALAEQSRETEAHAVLVATMEKNLETMINLGKYIVKTVAFRNLTGPIDNEDALNYLFYMNNEEML